MNILQESNFFLDSFFQPTSAYCIASPIVKPQIKKKFSCKYLIQIENESGFQVSRRIIGTKGCNMKKIIEKTLMEFPFVNNSVFSDSKKLIKLRLRGKGSGFLEGKRNSGFF